MVDPCVSEADGWMLSPPLNLLFAQITSAADSEAVTRQKLVKGHAYSLTGAVEVRSRLQG